MCRWEPWHCRLHLYHQWIAGGDVLAHSDSGARPSTDPDAEPNANSGSSTKPDAHPAAGAFAVSYAYAAPWTITHAYPDSYSDRVARPRRFGG